MLTFFAYSSCFIALNAFALSVFYGCLAGSVVPARALLVGLSTFALYNIAQLAPLRKRGPQNERGLWIQARSKFLWAGALSSLCAVAVLSVQLTLWDWLNFGHLFLLGLLYEDVFGNKPLREIPYLKPFFISYIWSMSCALPPVYDAWNPELLWMPLECFLFMLSLCVLFDIRDAREDKALGVKTLAVRFGPAPSKRTAAALLALSLFILAPFSAIPPWTLAVYGAVWLLVCAGLRAGSKEYAYLYGVDGLIGLKTLALWAAWPQ